jgi:hypothetical protein
MTQTEREEKKKDVEKEIQNPFSPFIVYIGARPPSPQSQSRFQI